jgi:hypothetical protein
MKQHINSKRYVHTKLHGVTLQKTVILRPTFRCCMHPSENIFVRHEAFSPILIDGSCIVFVGVFKVKVCP